MKEERFYFHTWVHAGWTATRGKMRKCKILLGEMNFLTEGTDSGRDHLLVITPFICAYLYRILMELLGVTLL